MLETELIDQLGYERCESKGRNSGNSRNGYYNSSKRDIQDMLEELYGIEVFASMISKITDKVWELVES